MQRFPLSLAAGVLPEYDPIALIEAAAAAGFDGGGIWIEPETWTAQQTRDTRAALAATGLRALDAEVVWIKPDVPFDRHRRVLDIAAELGAENILCVSSHPDEGETVAQLLTLCRQAEGTGLRVAFEFGVFSAVRTLDEGCAILDRVGHPLRALLIDPIHIDRSESSVAGIAAVDRALLPYAQFCDARAARPDPDDFDTVIVDAVDLREQCGEGALPLAAMLDALPPALPLSMELRSAALRERHPEPKARAVAVLDATRRWLAAYQACGSPVHL